MAFYVGLCKEKYVKRNKENVCMKEKLVSENSRKKKTKLFAWKSQSSICTRFYQNCQEYLYYSKQGVFGNDHIKICWQITVLEKEKDKINLLKESKFSIKIFPRTTNHIFIIQSKEY